MTEHRPSTTNVDIILVRPQNPQNAGFVARSIEAFGSRNLTLVSPEFPWNPSSPAYQTASGAHGVLDNARVCGTLDQAIAKAHHAAGFSRRTHDFDRPHLNLIDWAATLDTGKKTALVFGPEDFGLSNADKHLCHTLVAIPMREETLSLNLAHAVTVVLYELTRHRIETPPTHGPTPATHAELQQVLKRLTNILDRTNFFKSGRRDRQIETIRNLIHRLNLTTNEYATIMGLLNALHPPDTPPNSDKDHQP